jgi:serine/threonine protein kinase/tetratricopeptide (TPR) repeat protein
MNERAIFEAALDRKDPEERAAYLNEACGADQRLREQIEGLLKAHEMLGSFLAPPPTAPVATVDEPIHEGEGTVIGPYKLLEQIGEGGFGVVYMAEQTEPVRRKVALKVLKPGMDTRQVVARFEAERQALAIMDHPNIAKVFDGGATPSGRPYFVMELVKGVPITQFCDEQKLAPRQRLELFLPVCQAVQHAHQKGIIHRDLKPSNVLVSRHDTTPIVKVIDFGVAKALGQELTDKTLFTGIAQMIGTPLYMSPEQAGMSDLDVDTRSDIYSLGVLLYELLTGTTPFTKERFKTAAFDEIRRIIREEEPPRPSTRLSDFKDSLPSISAQRQTEPARLTKLVKGELDWIVMKALEKDRNRRYETANGFAMDVQRYLVDEPVAAGPPSASYRLKKFVRRNKGPVLTACFILLALLTAVVSLGFGVAAVAAERRQTELERQQTARQRDEKAQALEAEMKAHQAEQQAREMSMAALRDLTNDVVENQLASDIHLNEENKAFLRQIMKHYEGFAAVTADDTESRAIRAEGFARVGLLRHRLGELKEGEAAYREALAHLKQLVADFPVSSEFRQNLAKNHNNLGSLLYNTDRWLEAEAAYRAALALFKQLAADSPAHPEFRQNLAQSHDNLGLLLRQTGRLQDAEAAHREALAEFKQLAADFPPRPEFRHDLATAHNNLGILFRKMGRLPEAEAQYRDALAIRKQVAADVPARPKFRQELALSYNNLGILLRTTSRVAEAETAYRAALAIQKQLAADFPTSAAFRQQLALSHDNLGILLHTAGRLQEAESGYRDALAIRKQLAADFPTRGDFRQELARSHNNLGVLFKTTDRLAEAEAACRDALAIQKQLATDFLDRPEFRQELAESHENLGLLLSAIGRLADAEAAYHDALSIRKQLAAEFPTQPDIQNDLAATLLKRSMLSIQRREFAAAKADLEQAQPHHQAALKANPRHPDYRYSYRNNLWKLTTAEAGQRDQAAALRAAQRLRDLGWEPAANAYDATSALIECISIVAKHERLDEQQRRAALEFYGDQAVAMLRFAVSKGFRDVARLKKDKELDAVREREDFKKLLAELEKK